MNKYNKYLLVLIFSLAVSACGGGGGGGGDNDAGGSDGGNSAGNTGTASPTSTGGSPTSIDSLVVANENKLASTYQLNIDVNLPQLNGKQAYIVICPNNGQQIDYDSCFTKASLDDGNGKFELLLPNHQQSLVAEVTPMEAGSNPLTFTWQYDNQAQSTWLIP